MRTPSSTWSRIAVALACGLSCVWPVAPAAAQSQQALAGLIAELNEDPTVRGSEQSKSYTVLFDAYLELDPPPMEVSPAFNLTTIHPGMTDWDVVSGWAESNPGMAAAIESCVDRNIIGLPYGETTVTSRYREAGLVAAVGAGGELRIELPYIEAIETIAAYAVAETYRRLEAGSVDEAIRLSGAQSWVLRQMCDRQFLEEKLYSIELLIDHLSVARDALYANLDKLTPEQCRAMSWYDVPGLRPDRNRLHIPEGDRIVAEALLEAVFDENSQADPEEFASVFAEIQSQDAPMTRFGAAKRWRMIALVHDSLEASKERLELIYDDWWRRWRVQEYDTILLTETQFERTNPVRYAAVIYAMEDIEGVFNVRNQLVAAVNGTALAAGLCAYKLTYGVYPDDKEKTYGQFVRRRISDIDPYDEDFGPLRYRRISGRDTVEIVDGRIQLPDGVGLLYSVGRDHGDDRGRTHSDDGAVGDIVFWPPLRQLARDQGLIR